MIKFKERTIKALDSFIKHLIFLKILNSKSLSFDDYNNYILKGL